MKNELTFRSSVGQFNDFLESAVWADIQQELSIWLEGVRDGLEAVDVDEKDVYRNQGRANAIRYVLSLPETIRDQIADEQIQKKNEREENDNG